MQIKYDELVDLLKQYGPWSDVRPRTALYIEFETSGERIAKDSITYEASDQSTIVLDVDGEGTVIGMEII